MTPHRHCQLGSVGLVLATIAVGAILGWPLSELISRYLNEWCAVAVGAVGLIMVIYGIRATYRDGYERCISRRSARTRSSEPMTFDDDFVQIGGVRASLKSLGLEWPPPPFMRINNHGELPDLFVKRLRMSEITDEQRAQMTCSTYPRVTGRPRENRPAHRSRAEPVRCVTALPRPTSSCATTTGA